MNITLNLDICINECLRNFMFKVYHTMLKKTILKIDCRAALAMTTPACAMTKKNSRLNDGNYIV